MKIYGITGWKNQGKTGLMERLVNEFCARGLRVSTVKHAHHNTDFDEPGRDSHRHREAGATEVMLASPMRWALMRELRGEPEPPLSALLERLSPVDLVLVEGYKNDPHPKIEVFRDLNDVAPLAQTNQTIRAIASDRELNGLTVPVLDLNDGVAIADFISREVGL